MPKNVYPEDEIGHVRIAHCHGCNARVIQLRVDRFGGLAEWLCFFHAGASTSQVARAVADALRDAAVEMEQ